jgi:histidyl-tRNA synthetase
MEADAREARPVIFVIPGSPAEVDYALAVAAGIRALAPGAVVETDLTARGFPKGLSRAAGVLEKPERYGFRASSVRAVLLGADEREGERVTVKDLATGTQRSFARSALGEELGAARDR